LGLVNHANGGRPGKQRGGGYQPEGRLNGKGEHGILRKESERGIPIWGRGPKKRKTVTETATEQKGSGSGSLPLKELTKKETLGTKAPAQKGKGGGNEKTRQKLLGGWWTKKRGRGGGKQNPIHPPSD